ncbi:MAG: four-carbon acid sugar kinase family protein [Puniceicoccaceae bacterium]
MPEQSLIDLSLSIHPGLRGVRKSPCHVLDKDGWNSSTLELYSHSGTHMDAPIHFGCSDQTIDEIPLDRCLSVAWMADLSGIEPAALIKVSDLGVVADQIQAGQSLILKTGWSAYVDNASVYRDQLPRISEELALWCVEKQLNLIGVEPPSVADVNNLPEVTRIHEILLGGDIIIVEGLTNLDAVPPSPFQFGAFPLKIQRGDGFPCRAFASEGQVLLRTAIHQRLLASNTVVAVLDDDPTGTQTIHDINVHLELDKDKLVEEMQQGPGLFFILTNSRALPEKEADELARKIGNLLKKAGDEAGRKVLLVSRSDSTLRGHYPSEVNALAEAYGCPNAAHVLAPFFEEGGRLTIDDVHYVREAGELVPAASTPFAKDATFGYKNSNLRLWIQEKTNGAVEDAQIGSLGRTSGQDLQAELNDDEKSCYILNAVEEKDLEPSIMSILESMDRGRDFVFRSAAGVVRVLAGQVPVPLMSKEALRNTSGCGGLVVVGSYVPKTTSQLNYLRRSEALQFMEIEVPRVISGADNQLYLDELAKEMNTILGNDGNLVVYTSRELVRVEDKDESLRINVRVSDFLVSLIERIEQSPRFLVSKGGITSSEVARIGLQVKQALVMGQIIPGVPVWKLGQSSKFPGLKCVVFPGNLGDESSLLTAVEKLI